MRSVEAATEIALNNILYLTDFSDCAKSALPVATAIAGQFNAKIYVMHVLLPDVYTSLAPEFGQVVTAGLEQAAETKMREIESRLIGLPHQTTIERGFQVWPIVQREVERNDIDLVILGTRGRTGVQKLLFGSVAEEIWRHAKAPVLTTGPGATRRAGERFTRVLFATDFTAQSLTALPYAVSMAREYQAHLVFLHVIRQFKQEEILGELSAADAIHHLNQIVPRNAGLRSRPELVIKHGESAKSIVDTARACGADLIVLGIRNGDRFGVATHLAGTTAHRVVVNASCPVLTVRG